MYTATIYRQMRDTLTTTPKVLLQDVRYAGKEFRDHCWVVITPEIEKFIPYRQGQTLRISFEAKPKKYQTYGPEKVTLQSIKDIKILRDR